MMRDAAGVRFFDIPSSGRRFGCEVSRLEFTDSDGVVVSVTLNLDQRGKLFEVDVWKTDFQPVIDVPGSL